MEGAAWSADPSGNHTAKLEETIKPCGKTDASVIEWNWILKDFPRAAVQKEKPRQRQSTTTAAGRKTKEIDHMLDELIKRYPILERVREDIEAVYGILERCYENGGKLLIAGNGGSAADAEHIVGELMKGFVKRRPVTEEMKEALEKADPVRGKELSEKLQGGLPAIALVDHAALSTAFANDVDGMLSYAQQVNGYGKAGDVFLGISTSGNAENVMYAAVTAKAKGMKVIGLTGKTGGKLAKIADVAIIVPEQETYKIQELHLPIYHALCLMLEDRFYAE